MRILTLGGENFTNVQEVDLTPMSELTEVTIGNGTFSSGVTLICEGIDDDDDNNINRINKVKSIRYW